jgi:hypothetical protein
MMPVFYAAPRNGRNTNSRRGTGNLEQRCVFQACSRAFLPRRPQARPRVLPGLSDRIGQQLVEGLSPGSPGLPVADLLRQVALTLDRAVLELPGPGPKLAGYGLREAFEI